MEYKDKQVNKSAEQMLNKISEVINNSLKIIPKYSAAIVETVNDDGTVNIYFPPDNATVFTNISNQTPFTLVPGDAVEVTLKSGSYDNCWISAKHQTSFLNHNDTENNSGINQIQSDYAQNDSNSMDYIKNRPFYDTSDGYNYSVSYNIDLGNPFHEEEGESVFLIRGSQFPPISDSVKIEIREGEEIIQSYIFNKEYIEREGSASVLLGTIIWWSSVYSDVYMKQIISFVTSEIELPADTKGIFAWNKMPRCNLTLTFTGKVKNITGQSAMEYKQKLPYSGSSYMNLYTYDIGKSQHVLCNKDDDFSLAAYEIVDIGGEIPYTNCRLITKENVIEVTDDYGIYGSDSNHCVILAYTLAGLEMINSDLVSEGFDPTEGTPFVIMPFEEVELEGTTFEYVEKLGELKKIDGKFLSLKTINGKSLLGEGNIEIQEGGNPTWGSITGTLSQQTDLNTALNNKQPTLISGSNIKTINGQSLLGSGNITIESQKGLTEADIKRIILQVLLEKGLIQNS